MVTHMPVKGEGVRSSSSAVVVGGAVRKSNPEVVRPSEVRRSSSEGRRSSVETVRPALVLGAEEVEGLAGAARQTLASIADKLREGAIDLMSNKAGFDVSKLKNSVAHRRTAIETLGGLVRAGRVSATALHVEAEVATITAPAAVLVRFPPSRAREAGPEIDRLGEEVQKLFDATSELVPGGKAAIEGGLLVQPTRPEYDRAFRAASVVATAVHGHPVPGPDVDRALFSEAVHILKDNLSSSRIQLRDDGTFGVRAPMQHKLLTKFEAASEDRVRAAIEVVLGASNVDPGTIPIELHWKTPSVARTKAAARALGLAFAQGELRHSPYTTTAGPQVIERFTPSQVQVLGVSTSSPSERPTIVYQPGQEPPIEFYGRGYNKRDDHRNDVYRQVEGLLERLGYSDVSFAGSYLEYKVDT